MESRPPEDWPFRHVRGDGLIPPETAADLARDFPRLDKSGFYPVEELTGGPTFARLVEELRSSRLAEILEAKLGCRLLGKPRLIVARKWSSAKDGRPHTDSADKVATLLIYLNPEWCAESGRLRMLTGPDAGGPGTDPIDPCMGAFVAFARADNSWHGHAPFTGERRVIQVTWLIDEHAVERKAGRHRRGAFWKRLFPTGVFAR